MTDSALVAPALKLLCIGPLPRPLSGHVLVEVTDSDDAALERATASSFDALVLRAELPDALALATSALWSALLPDLAVLIVLADPDAAGAERLISAGVQDLLTPDELNGSAFERRLRHAVARKALEREARKTWSTDLNTGLPNRAQLFEHLSQLIALRARQPAPMGLLALRIEGLDGIAAQHGAEAVQLVRRKVAVRLRAAVRSSDVVASLGGGAYAVLLAKIEAPADAQRVALKLTRSLRDPFNVLGAPVGVSAHVGIAVYPTDGKDGDPLLRHADAAALAAQRRNTAAANE